uniref:Uncharacterized protein n=1 Tax=Timema cristinae TaxID=61476 RepID=A0A7R9D5W3_TIMCR|nr:unnamed protein product [Timema cristinae]
MVARSSLWANKKERYVKSSLALWSRIVDNCIHHWTHGLSVKVKFDLSYFLMIWRNISEYHLDLLLWPLSSSREMAGIQITVKDDCVNEDM